MYTKTLQLAKVYNYAEVEQRTTGLIQSVTYCALRAVSLTREAGAAGAPGYHN